MGQIVVLSALGLCTVVGVAGTKIEGRFGEAMCTAAGLSLLGIFMVLACIGLFRL